MRLLEELVEVLAKEMDFSKGVILVTGIGRVLPNTFSTSAR